MGISNGRDTLSRVAFETSSGLFFKFRINPASISEKYAARNTFLQGESTVNMQGYGQGLHTISISGTTGVNHGKGFDLMMQLKSIIVDQINNAHDSSNGSYLTNPAYTTLKFHNFTDNESWLVEIDPQGFSIDQDKDNPLSFTYSIYMVVVGKADSPSTNEIDWVQLGTNHPSFTPTSVSPTGSYVYGQKIKDLDANGYIKSARQFEDSKYNTIDNYGQSGMYKAKSELSQSEVVALYKIYYGGTLSDLDLQNFVANSPYYGGSGLGNYGTADKETASVLSKALPVTELQTIYQELYGDTLNSVDYDAYSRMNAVYTAMKKGTIYNYSGDTVVDTSNNSLSVPDAVSMFSILYGKTVKEEDFTQVINSGVSFASGKQETINNYGQGSLYGDSMDSFKDSNAYVFPEYINPWESYENSVQSTYSNNGYYTHPLVSKDSLKYSFDALTNLLKV